MQNEQFQSQNNVKRKTFIMKKIIILTKNISRSDSGIKKVWKSVESVEKSVKKRSVKKNR